MIHNVENTWQFALLCLSKEKELFEILPLSIYYMHNKNIGILWQ